MSVKTLKQGETCMVRVKTDTTPLKKGLTIPVMVDSGSLIYLFEHVGIFLHPHEVDFVDMPLQCVLNQ